MSLRVSPNLSLPLDAVTQTIVVYGGKGMGKTNFGAVLAEELARHRLRFAVLDPVGVWWGLQHDADGKGAGLDVLLLGGKRGDLPIEPTGGAVVADLVVDERVNVVVDISRRSDGKMWSAGEKVRFVADYCTRLFERQGEESRPLMQIIDEAGRFVPQVIPHGAVDIARCVGAVEQMVELGRNVGIGTCLITQRSARMNKSVSELAECMIAFRTVGPRSIESILDWFGEHVEKGRWKELIETIRRLPRGHALVVSPGWLDFEGVAKIRARQTYDSSATPKADSRRHAPRKLAKADLETYRARIAATVAKANAENPAVLQARIRDLERDLQQAKARTERPSSQEPRAKTVRIEIPILKDEHAARLERAIDALRKIADGLTVALGRAKAAVQEQAQGPASIPVLRGPMARTAAGNGDVLVRPRPIPVAADGDLAALKAGERRMFEAVAAWYPKPVTRRQAALQAGIGNANTISSYVTRLKAHGVVQEGPGGLRLTGRGEQVARELGVLGAMPTSTAEMVQYFGRMLKAGERRMLEVLVAAWPDALTRSELAGRAGIENPNTMSSYVTRLRQAGLVVTQGMHVQASEELFPQQEARR